MLRNIPAWEISIFGNSNDLTYMIFNNVKKLHHHYHS
jgi:hypothetical protein